MHFYCLKRGENNQIYKDLSLAEIVRPWMPPWSQPDTVNTSLQPSFYVSFDSTVDFPLADVRLSTRNGKV